MAASGTETVLHGMWPRCACRRQRHRSHRLRRLAHQRCVIAATHRRAHGGDRGRSGLRPREGGAALSGAARTPTMSPSACSPPSGRVSSLRWSRCRRVPCPCTTAAISFRGWCPTSTDCRTCRCGCCNRSLSRPELPHWLSVSSRPLLPSSAAVLAASLAVAAVAAPAATSWANRRAEARLAKARAELSTRCRHAAERESRPRRLRCRSAAPGRADGTRCRFDPDRAVVRAGRRCRARALPSSAPAEPSGARSPLARRRYVMAR